MKYLLFIICSLSAVLSAQEIVEDTATEFAPGFSYVDGTGNTHALSSHKGEVVYISFWASWCKPCIQSFEKYKDVRREMHAKGITLLNISIDKDVNKWHAAMEKYDIIGHHGNVSDLQLIHDYQLYNIPRYEIVGKQGQLLYLDRSDGKSIMDNFDAFLKQ